MFLSHRRLLSKRKRHGAKRCIHNNNNTVDTRKAVSVIARPFFSVSAQKINHQPMSVDRTVRKSSGSLSLCCEPQ